MKKIHKSWIEFNKSLFALTNELDETDAVQVVLKIDLENDDCFDTPHTLALINFKGGLGGDVNNFFCDNTELIVAYYRIAKWK